MEFTLNFGKYEGKTLEQIFFTDPGYIWWLMSKKIHLDPKRFSEKHHQHLMSLVDKATNLKIPGNCQWCKQKPVTKMFLTRHPSGGLARVDFDCDDCRPPSSSVSVLLRPSFYSPDYFRGYDKTGSEFMVAAIKEAYFGNASYRMTKNRCKEFFCNENNFW